MSTAIRTFGNAPPAVRPLQKINLHAHANMLTASFVLINMHVHANTLRRKSTHPSPWQGRFYERKLHHELALSGRRRGL
jgi:hypothetical protein